MILIVVVILWRFVVALFDGKLDAVDLMAIEHHERQEKLNHIIKTIKESKDVRDITPLCCELEINLTSDEFAWILEQVKVS